MPIGVLCVVDRGEEAPLERPLLDVIIFWGGGDEWGRTNMQRVCRWATKKGGGSSANGRTSQPKMLGVKKYGGAASGCPLHPSSA